MSVNHVLLIIIGMSLITFAVRAVPFYFIEIFKEHPVIRYLADMLPPVIMLTLVLYSYKGVTYQTFPYGLPEIIGGGALIAAHVWRRNLLLSMVVGMTIYIIAFEIFRYIPKF